MKTANDLVAAAKSRIQEISQEDADQAIRDSDMLIDVREADEFAMGHIPGAMLIPRGLLEFKFSGTPEFASRDLSIVIYCKTSGRAALAASALHEMGYLKVKSIAGGFDAWAAAGKPVAKPNLPKFD